jgi:hypothetical protein
MTMLLILVTVVLSTLALVATVVVRKQMHLWLPAYLARPVAPRAGGPVHVMFCFVDHFEPQWGKADYATEVRRVAAWRKRYVTLASRHRDSDGRPPQHSFFYPEEEYRPEHLDQLVELCADGFGEIEVHLHHDHDTEAGLREKLTRFIHTLDQRHGALSRDPQSGRPVFGFIHGNWCLDNSRADGRWCGVDNEITVLRELGCYADFTLPSAPSDTQTRKINSIYYATDDPDKPKSHDDGVDVAAGREASGDLLIVQGPLALNWASRKWGLLPRTENADVRTGYPPSPERTDLWVRQHIHVRGRPDWIFIKVHTHGTQERDMDTLLGEPVDRMFSDLERRYNDGRRYVLHYVTAREVFNIVKAAEHGHGGNPNAYRDYLLPPPPMRQRPQREVDSRRAPVQQAVAPCVHS